MFLRATFLAGLAGLTACVSTESTNIRTSGIYAALGVVTDGRGGSTAYGSLRLDELSNTVLELEGGDRLRASADGETVTMTRQDGYLGDIYYVADLLADAEDTTVTIAFERDTDDSAPNSNVTIPAPFDLLEPLDTDTFSRGTDDIYIGWTNSGSNDRMHWVLDGTCIPLQVGSLIGDSGGGTIPAGSIDTFAGSESTTCDITLELYRERQGTLDPTYGKGGHIEASQLRWVTFTSEP